VSEHAVNTVDDSYPPSEMLERLTAYLDGELDAAESRLVEERLAADPQWAAELKRLERAWDLLDRLPKAEVDADFTQSTVEMIALDAAAAIAAVEHPRPARRWLGRATALGGVAAAVLGGFLCFDTLRPHRDDPMLQALPLLKHLDVYIRTEPGETIEFARDLRDAHVAYPKPVKRTP
jgi:hypothetical protein